MRRLRRNHEVVRLHARPRGAPPGSVTPGIHVLGLGRERDGLLSVPPGYRADVPAPLLVLLHGAGADAASLLPAFRQQADAAGVLVLAPDSRGATWDVIRNGFGPDVEFLDTALEKVFSSCAVQPDRIAIGGFSDGASYALSLGIANGDLLRHILAFSPGFAVPPVQEGQPRIFISHGSKDAVLPIERCSRVLYPRLANAGYEVFYREFDGGHSLLASIIAEAFRWWLEDGPSR